MSESHVTCMNEGFINCLVSHVALVGMSRVFVNRLTCMNEESKVLRV